jgi:hypothetical protein
MHNGPERRRQTKRYVATGVSVLGCLAVVLSFSRATVWRREARFPDGSRTVRSVEFVPPCEWKIGSSYGCGRGFSETASNYGPLSFVRTYHGPTYAR